MCNLINAIWNRQLFSQRNQDHIVNQKSFVGDCIESVTTRMIKCIKNLVIFTEEILNGKLEFLCCVLANIILIDLQKAFDTKNFLTSS